MDRVLRPHAAYAAAYLDDVIIHSTTWAEHVRRVDAVLGSLRRAGLTANPGKCAVGRTEGGTVSGVPLGGWASASSGRQDSGNCSLPAPQDKKRGEAVFGAGGLL
ncbi:hypothetical protein FVB03_26975 [Escherichia coli]|nr:hypothetical protein [Escherichia coli]